MTLPPGPSTPAPLQTAAWVTRPGPWMLRMRREHGNVFTASIVPDLKTVVLVAEPELIKEIFRADPEVLRAGEGNVVLRPVVGSSSLLQLDGDEHMQERKLMLPPFHGEKLKGHAELMEQIVLSEVERWAPGEELALAPQLQAVTLEIILRVVFGVREGEEVEGLRQRLQRVMDVGGRPIGTALLIARNAGLAKDFIDRDLKKLDVEIFAAIERRRTDPDLAEHDDILSMLIQARREDGSPMSDRELRDELMTLLVAGHETTATGLAWTFERLMRNPAALDRLTAEARAGASTEYADAVVRESLRLRPPIPLVARKVKSPYRLGEWEIPPGATIAPAVWLTHRREDIYPDPHAFKPERFLDASPDTYAWLPFGGGVRRCIGASFAIMEMRIALQAIVRTVELRAPDARMENMRRRAIVFAPSRGARALVAARAA
ncbi:MAG: cytochrome P450 [Thermoleophilaceae bacterium]|nr:cytochrome P450 [Thermoleophilaceae bacterium]